MGARAKSPPASARKNGMNFSTKPPRSRSLPPKQSQRQTAGQADRQFTLRTSPAPAAPATTRLSASQGPSDIPGKSAGSTAMRGPSTKKVASSNAAILDRKPWGAIVSTVRPTKPRSSLRRSKSTPPPSPSRIPTPREERRSVRFGETIVKEIDKGVTPKPSVPVFRSQNWANRRSSMNVKVNAFEPSASNAIKRTFAAKKVRGNQSSPQSPSGTPPSAVGTDVTTTASTTLVGSGPRTSSVGPTFIKASVKSVFSSEPHSSSLPPPQTPSPTKRRASRKAPMPILG
jgi:hypothetical protein